MSQKIYRKTKRRNPKNHLISSFSQESFMISSTNLLIFTMISWQSRHHPLATPQLTQNWRKLPKRCKRTSRRPLLKFLSTNCRTLRHGSRARFKRLTTRLRWLIRRMRAIVSHWWRQGRLRRMRWENSCRRFREK